MYGGGIYFGSLRFTLSAVSIVENRCGWLGGGVYYGVTPTSDGQVCASACAFGDNISPSGHGNDFASPPVQLLYQSNALAPTSSVSSLQSTTIGLALFDAFGQHSSSPAHAASPVLVSAVRWIGSVSTTAVVSTTPSRDSLVWSNGTITFELQMAAAIGDLINVSS